MHLVVNTRQQAAHDQISLSSKLVVLAAAAQIYSKAYNAHRIMIRQHISWHSDKPPLKASGSIILLFVPDSFVPFDVPSVLAFAVRPEPHVQRPHACVLCTFQASPAARSVGHAVSSTLLKVASSPSFDCLSLSVAPRALLLPSLPFAHPAR